ncbi:MAG: chitobiase/beta-hexosaminidase C-terminal domain-containing protein [Chloroflexota bacterium]
MFDYLFSRNLIVRFLAYFLTILLIFVANHPSQISASGPGDDADIVYNPNHHETTLIEVKFKEGFAIRLRQGQPTDLNNQVLRSGRSNKILDQLADGKWSLTHFVGEDAINRLQTRAVQRGVSLPLDLNLFFRLELPPGMTVPEAITLVKQLNEVADAWPIPKPIPSTPPDFQDFATPGVSYQRYLDPAPEGIDARYAWQGGGGAGAGIRICNVEYDYNDDHGDLPSVSRVKIIPPGLVPDAWRQHGTAVMGVLGGLDNGWGITGIAHDASLHFETVVDGAFTNIAGAISLCASELDFGDVIIIEQQIAGPNRPVSPADGDQTGLVPVEWYLPTYTAIQLAVSSGITVIEAAGNGGQNLDSAPYVTGNGGHYPFTAAKDSGAIIVGAGAPPNGSDIPERSRLSFSNYGSTVDMQGWGALVVAPGYGDLYDEEGDDLSYTNFSGTSSASPIVAASAAIVQSNYKRKHGSPATPSQIKSILRNTGTPQQGATIIGPLPNLKAAIEDIWDFSPPNPPVITPASGVYQMPMQVTIDYGAGQDGSNTAIRYTLDGSEPTADSFIFIPEFNDVLYLNYGATVRAKAFRYYADADRRFESEIATETYISSTPKVATPEVSPGGGTYSQPHQVVITTDTPGATIRYRTDGRNISFFYPGMEYTGPITLNPGTYKITARAYKEGYYKSDQAKTDDITVNALTLPAPVIYPGGDNFAGSVVVYLGSTVLGADIHYTLDGSTPTESSPQFIEPFELTTSTTVKARVYLDGYTESDIASEVFQVTGQADTPTITPDGGTHGDSIQVTLSNNTDGSTMRYTTNGAEPTSYSTEYTGPFTLNIGEHIVKAKTFLSGASPSDTASAQFTVYDTVTALDPPVISPDGGNYNGPITVTISTNTENVFLSYTTDGSDPGASGTVKPYNGPFQLLNSPDTYFVRARAFELDLQIDAQSNIATFVVVTPTFSPIITPTFSVPGGEYTNTVSLQIDAPDHLSAINKVRRLYITTDGTDPVVEVSPTGGDSPPRNRSISKPTTVKAIAGQVGWFDSPMITAEYTFRCDTPAISPTSDTYTDTVTVSMSTGTLGVTTMTYTTDGSEPTESSPVYTTPFSLTVGTHTVKAKCFRANYLESETAHRVFVIEPSPVAPTFITQPQSQTVNTGQTITFTTVVTGTPYPNLTWRRDGILIAGETEAELVIPAARVSDMGYYEAIASNSAGTVTSTQALLTVNGPELTLSKFGPATIMDDSLITYTIVVTNIGDGPAHNLAISDTVPTGATYVSGGAINGQIVHWAVETLAAQAVVSRTFSVTATQTITNSDYQVVADDGHQAQGIVPVVTVYQAPHLDIHKTGPLQAQVGEEITYTLWLTNSGALAATNVQVIDQVPFGATYIRGGILSNNSVSWDIETLLPQTSIRVTFTVTASQSIVNDTYQVTADGGYQTVGTSIVPTTIGVMLPADGGTISPSAGVTISTSSNTFSETVILHYTAQGITATGSLSNVGVFYNLGATYLDGSPAQIQPGTSYTIIVSYNEADIPPGVNEEDLALYYWDGTMWVKEETGVVDTVANTITAMPTHFSLWAILGPSTSTGDDDMEYIYVPVILK